MKNIILDVKSLKKSYKDVEAVKDFSIQISEGEIVALLGPNGAGKTTAINCLTTLVKADAVDSLVINGLDVTHSIKKSRKFIGLCPQHLNLYEDSTVKENLLLQGYFANYPKKLINSRIQALLEVVDLIDKQNEFVKNLSGGMKRRLQIARALLTEPKLILLDEPTIGLSPETRQNIWSYIRKLKSSGYSILLTTHYMEEADQLADTIFIMDHGRIIAVGAPEKLKEQFINENRILLRSEKNFSELIDLLSEKNYHFKSLNDNSLLLESGNSKLSLLIRDLEGIELDEFTMKKPNLEDIFLELTGNKLRGSRSNHELEA